MVNQTDISKMTSEEKRKLLKDLLAKRKINKEKIPLSSGQKGLWFIHQINSKTYAYNVPCAFRIDGKLNIDILKKAFQLLTERHQILKTIIDQTDEGEPFQYISSEQALFFHEESISNIEESRIESFLKSIAQEPFDLKNDALIRTYIFSRSSTAHILLINIHHIIFDGISFLILISELMKIYDALLSGKNPDLPHIKYSYADYVKWQNKMLGSNEGKKHKEFWLEKLSGDLPVLTLPKNNNASAIVKTDRYEIYRNEISLELSQKLIKLASENGVYLFSVLLSAFKILLHRYSGQMDIITGIPFAGRTSARFEDMIGYFINMMPMRTKLTDNMSFDSLLQQIHQFSMDALIHQDYPLPEIVKSLGIKREKAIAPLFQTSFILQNWVKDFENNFLKNDYALKLKPLLNIQQEEDFDLTLEIVDGDNFLIVFKYNANTFDNDTITGMADYYKVILERIVENPQQTISKLTLLTDAESKKIIYALNNTKAEYPKEKCIHQLFEEQAKNKPDNIALIFDDKELSYKALNEKTNIIANKLTSMGITSNDFIGICMERSLDMIAALLGILKAGAAYIPMDPLFPSKRISYMIEDTNTPVILAHSNTLHLVSDMKTKILNIDSIDYKSYTIKKKLVTNPQNLAYIMFTSGSTGRPKGVKVTHKNVVNFLNSMAKKPGFSSKDTLLAVTTISFDISVLEIFLPLTTGGKCIIASKEESLDGKILESLIKKNNVTVMQATPATWRILEIADMNRYPSLKALCGGEPLPPDLALFLTDRCQSLWNMYGPTETTIWSTIDEIKSKDGISIGQPIDNTTIYILSKNLQPVPFGVSGDLYIGGDGVTNGYIKNPDLTKKRFIKNPLNNDPSDIIYNTGDIARYSQNLKIECLGRSDSQVKIRGFRIEPGEIEAILSNHPDSLNAVVTVNSDDQGEKYLAAYLVENGQQRKDPSIYRTWLKKTLPNYMIPSYFIFMDSFPLTPNGKIDRKSLPEPKLSKPAEKTSKPQNKIEKIISDIWKEELKIEYVDMNDNFFEIGGHSFLVVKVNARLNKILNTDIPVAKLFQYPTIKHLAAYIARDAKKLIKNNISSNSTSYSQNNSDSGANIAIIGMACRFPEADNIYQFWENIKNGRESIRHFSDQELIHSGIDPDLIQNPDYIKAHGYLKDIDKFDASFFKITPLEAEYIDPQQRIFLECSWEALEDAGYDISTYNGLIGIYGGSSFSRYMSLFNEENSYNLFLGNSQDFLCSRVAYKLNLKGPSIGIQTACSTSLVAVHEAIKSLLDMQCDMALAGGVSLWIPQKQGYLYDKTLIFSKDGHCRPFDDNASGTVFGSGSGLVVLKRLEDAISDHDHIYAVIKGTAINNDGSLKVGFTAPSVDGQAKAILKSQKIAGISAETISYIEAHGTGTRLGDPIEIEALTKAFMESTNKKRFCAIGAVKSNIGHLDSAAGAAGLIKTVMALKNKTIPPSINFEKPNNEINFEKTPFFVKVEANEWKSNDNFPRRAGISSLGVGGVNAHIIVEEYIDENTINKQEQRINDPVVFILSAKNEACLKAYAKKMILFFEKSNKNSIQLIDIAYTSQVGRKTLEKRLAVIAFSIDDIINKLKCFYENNRAVDNLFIGSSKQNRDALNIFEDDETFQNTIDTWIEQHKYSKIIELWVKGLDFDWNKLYGKNKPNRVSLPTYPFAKERHWIDSENHSLSKNIKPEKTDLLMFTPTWKEISIHDDAPTIHIEQHIVVLCDLNETIQKSIEDKMADTKIILLQSKHKTIHERFEFFALRTFEEVQFILKEREKRKTLFQIVVIHKNDNQMLKGLIGILKSAHLENPGFIGQFIEIEENIFDSSIIKENRKQPHDVHIKYQSGKRYVEIYEEIKTTPEKIEIPWNNKNIYLITGGAGGLGFIFAKELNKHVNNPVLIIAGRSNLDPNKQKHIDELINDGNNVHYIKADVTQKADIHNLISKIEKEFGKLNGIIHAAGIINDNFIINKTESEFKKVIAPKVKALVLLDNATKHINLDFFVIFSSGVGVTGNIGQADYACANAFMDAYAAYRDDLVKVKKRTGHTISINWPLWKDGGMTIDQATQNLMKQTTGMNPMKTETGIRAFYHGFSLALPQFLVMEGNASLMRKYMLEKTDYRVADNNTQYIDHQHVDSDFLHKEILNKLKIILGKLTKVALDDIDAKEHFEDYGLDSIIITNFNQQLEPVFSEIPKTLLYEYNNLESLTQFLITEFPKDCIRWIGIEKTKSLTIEVNVNDQSINISSDKEALEQIQRKTNQPVAIIGISGRYPGSKNIEEYWDNLKNGKVFISEIPDDRWDWKEYYLSNRGKAAATNKSYSKWGAFLDDIELFDPLFFNISPKDASNIDPQERIFLEECWKAMEDAGYSPSALSHELSCRTGVFGGITKQGVPSTSFSSLVNRVSYMLNLQGPSIPVDSMCASSLTAIHMACEYIRSGKGDMAIAGGVNLYLTPETYTILSRSQTISDTSTCAAFGSEGNGFVPGEGVGVAILKSLDKAIEDQDFIYAVIRGTAINHGGKTTGYSMPDPNREASVIIEALHECNIDPKDIGYIESAANGSLMGDAIEMEALSKVFSNKRKTTGAYRIGSVKPNIGHCEAASGIAQLTKVILSLKHKTLVPTLVSENVNDNINFQKLPFGLNKELTKWESLDIERKKIPRRTGITSIGAGGLNCHIIVEEFQRSTTADQPSQEGQPIVFILSARNTKRLQDYAKNWIVWLMKNQNIDLHKIAYTLQTGREEMPARLAVVVKNQQELTDRLQFWVENSDNPDFSYFNISKKSHSSSENISSIIKSENLDKLAQLWVEGNAIHWSELYEKQLDKVPGLPSYPFERRNCSQNRINNEKQSEKNMAVEFYTFGASNRSSVFAEEYLTFCPFEQRIPGFSMTSFYLNPEQNPDILKLVRSKQIEMRQVLFCKEDFNRIEKFLDIGCGHGTDVIQIANLYPHIKTHGFTITKAQATLGNKRITEMNLTDRAKIFNKDSSKDSFPDNYDLIAGIEVTFHIRNKEGLFGNIASSLTNNGILLLMDYTSNLRGAIVDPNVEINISTNDEWIDILSKYNLKILEIIDVSPQIANFLYDPDIDKYMKDLPEVAQNTFRNYANQNISLEKGWISYCLFRIEKNNLLSKDELIHHNTHKIANKKPYTEALKEMLHQGEIPYPKSLTGSDKSSELQNQMETMEPSMEKSEVKKTLIDIFQKILGLTTKEIDELDSFKESGISSINAVELLESINSTFDLNLPTSVIFESNSLNELTKFVFEKSHRKVKKAKKTSTNIVRPKTEIKESHNLNGSDAIAIIGLSCRCAGAENQDEYWDIVSNGKNSITRIKNKQWLDFFRLHSDKKIPSKYGKMDDSDCFDASFFNISPKEAAAMDMNQRILLEECYKAIEDAGYDPSSLSEKQVGVFIGTMGSQPIIEDYSHFSMLGYDSSILASRIAYFLNLKGAALAINTACSSSLVAIDAACKRLVNNEIDMAVSGGITIYNHPRAFIAMNSTGMLSSSEQCRPFDNDADGVVVGDGAGILILKRLNDARRDNDQIYGIIRSIGTNQDGRTSGITVPSFVSQSSLEQSIYKKSAINTEDIQYIEAHGTGTKLGDPVEIHALTDAFSKFTPKKGFCAIGSVKANIGHTAAAAGVIGLIKILLSFKNKQIPPSINFEKENEHIDFDNCPVYVNTSLKEWPLNSKGTRLGALSSFGFSGTNVHAIIEEAFDKPLNWFDCNRLQLPCIFVLSAKTEEQLKLYAKTMAHYIESSHKIDSDLYDIAFTSQVGREPMEERFAMIVSAVSELITNLKHYASGNSNIGNFYSGNINKSKEVLALFESYEELHEAAVEKLIKRGKYSNLLDLWVKGFSFDWNQLYTEGNPRRISLPTYPFKKEQFKIDIMPVQSVKQPIVPDVHMKNMPDHKSPVKETSKTTSVSKYSIETIIKELSASLSEALFLETVRIDVSKKFIDLGLDSIIGVEWVHEINKKFGLSLEAAKLYDYPTVSELAEFIHKELDNSDTHIQTNEITSPPEITTDVLPKPKNEVVLIPLDDVKTDFITSLNKPENISLNNESILTGNKLKKHGIPEIQEVESQKIETVHEKKNLVSYQSQYSNDSLKKELIKTLAEALYVEPEKVDINKKFVDMGLDSIIGVEWTNTLSKTYGISIDTVWIYDHPTIEEFSKMLHKTLSSQEHQSETIPALEKSLESVIEESIESKAHSEKRHQSIETNAPLAIVGISGKYPDAPDIDQYWKNLIAGKNSIHEIPSSRWDWKEYFGDPLKESNKTHIKWGGFIDGIENFDPLFFGITPKEAELMDPQNRLLMLYVWIALESAGITRKKLAERSTGLFIASTVSEYSNIVSVPWNNPLAIASGSPSMIANRISHMLNLRGPSEYCDTTCSSSLVALHRAIQTIQSGECEQAIVGAINLLLSPASFVALESIDFLSKKGVAKSFQSGADGCTLSEGVGAIIIKPLDNALKDNDRIYALIRGVGVSHGGSGMSLIAPTGRGMKAAITNAYKKSGINPQTISYVEAHGTATIMGDAVEIGALKSGYEETAAKFVDAPKINSSCYISSLKPCIGHVAIASGMAALTKVVKALNNKTIPGIPGYQQLNENISLDDSRFDMSSENQPWEKLTDSDGSKLPRRAAVNNYGFDGMNAHAIFEEYNDDQKDRINNKNDWVNESHLFVLSAKNNQQLNAYVEKMAAFLEKMKKVNLADYIYTLQVGREPMNYRLAIIVNNTDELLENLKTFLTNKHDNLDQADHILYGSIDTDDLNTKQRISDEELENHIMNRDYFKLSQHWITGVEIPWDKLYNETNISKISLPTYPFENRRCWVDKKTELKIASNEIKPDDDTDTIDIITISSKDYIRNTISQISGLSPEEFNLSRPLSAFGFDSIRLIQLLQRIQAEVDPLISLTQLRECKTISDIIKLFSPRITVKQQMTEQKISVSTDIDRSKFPELVRLGSGNSGTPIFWFHAGLGAVWSYVDIATRTNRPFYGIQARGFMTERLPLHGIEAMAAYYISIIQSVQRSGPYDLGGYSLGGAIAYEITRQLQELGEEVNTIVMLDTYDSSLDVPEVSMKSNILRSVNRLIFAELQPDLEKKYEVYISKNEINTEVNDDEFLNQVITIAKSRGIAKSDDWIRKRIIQTEAVLRTMAVSNYTVVPLSRSHEVTCYYFRNKSGLFFGQSAPFHAVTEKESTWADHKEYWKEWEQNLPNIHMTDVNASNHMRLLDETEPAETIIKFCEELYSDNGLSKTNIKLGTYDESIHDQVQMPIPPDFPVRWPQSGDEKRLWVHDTGAFPGQISPLDFHANICVVWENFNKSTADYGIISETHYRHINTYFYATSPQAPIVDEKLRKKLDNTMDELGTRWHNNWLPKIKKHLLFWKNYPLKSASMNQLIDHINETQRRIGRLWYIHNELYFPVILSITIFEELYLELFDNSTQSEAYELLIGFDDSFVKSNKALWELSRKALSSSSVCDILINTERKSIINHLKEITDGQEFLSELNAYLEDYGRQSYKKILRNSFWIEDPSPVLQKLADYINHPEMDFNEELKKKAEQKDNRQNEFQKRLLGYPEPVKAKINSFLQNAQIANMIREEHNFWIDTQALYYQRQVFLEIGNRLKSEGRIKNTDDIFYLTLEEIIQRAKNISDTSSYFDIVSDRKAQEKQFLACKPPLLIGTPPSKSISLPDDPLFRAITKVTGFVTDMKVETDLVPEDRQEKHEKNVLHVIKGNPGSKGIVRGRAKVIHNLSEIENLTKGDILVTMNTQPSWASHFMNIAAIVTDNGGALSHSAIVAREYNIPSVVGTGIATSLIKDGQFVEVDGNSGVVKIIEN